MVSSIDNFSVRNKNIGEYLDEIDKHIRPFMLKALKSVPKAYPLQEGIAFQINTGGKRLRAALCVTSCAMFCGSMMRAMNFAATIEHLQNFMLIHDDIADEDEIRRIRDSIWKKYGIGHGLNIGDAFISLSAHSILDSPYSSDLKLKLIKLVSELGLDVAEGQSLDINLRGNNSPNIDEYIKCTEKKTGAFLSMATVGGGLIGGADKEQIQTLNNYAKLSGVAFQVIDDIIDITGTKGRAIGSDIKEGKRTILAIYASEKCSIAEKEKLFRILNRPRNATTEEETQWVCRLYQNTDALNSAENMANSIMVKANQYLSKIPDSEAKNIFFSISNFITQRKR